MAINGRCLIDISVDTRAELQRRGAKPRAKSYDVVLEEIFEDNNKLTVENEKLNEKNDKLQNAFIEISKVIGDNNK